MRRGAGDQTSARAPLFTAIVVGPMHYVAAGVPPRVNAVLRVLQVEWEISPSEIDFSAASALGKGAYGEVVKARWRGLPVAIKR